MLKDNWDYICWLWKKATKFDRDTRREQALIVFIKRVAKGSDPHCLTWREEVKVINGIKALKRKQAKANRQTESILRRSLTPIQRDTLSKFNPFRWERNELIISLNRRGMGQTLLARLSGLSRPYIYNIIKNETKKGGVRWIKPK